ncbi:hypothetical protein ACFP81_10975 [Deinococcus lacus]|uniref:Uncharacterized protein n=1 Tax=Deinococcus lacus TaxID=392561 RepID=A0ABW1YDV8_9DEIO
MTRHQALVAGVGRSLSAFWPGLTCEAVGETLYVYAERRLVSNLALDVLLGPDDTAPDVAWLLTGTLDTVLDDLLRDWGRWDTPALAAKLDALKLATAKTWQEGERWRWGYRLPGGEVWELEPVTPQPQG